MKSTIIQFCCASSSPASEDRRKDQLQYLKISSRRIPKKYIYVHMNAKNNKISATNAPKVSSKILSIRVFCVVVTVHLLSRKPTFNCSVFKARASASFRDVLMLNSFWTFAELLDHPSRLNRNVPLSAPRLEQYHKWLNTHRQLLKGCIEG